MTEQLNDTIYELICHAICLEYEGLKTTFYKEATA